MTQPDPTSDLTSDAIVVTAYFQPLPGKLDEVVAALQPAIAAVHTEPGCLLYAIHAAPNETIVMIEKWASVADLDAHGGGSAVQALGRSLDGLLAHPAAVSRLQPIPAGTSQQGVL